MFAMALKLTKAGVYIKPEVLVPVKVVEDNPFSKGTAVIGSGWSNQFVAFSTAAKRPIVMAMPPKGGDKPGLYVKPSMFFSLSAKSALKDEGVKFINYFTNDVDANKVLLAERGVPLSSKVRDGIKDAVPEATRMTFDYLSQVEKVAGPIDPPEPSGSAEVLKAIKASYDEVVFGKTTPKDAAAKFMKTANEVLAKNKK